MTELRQAALVVRGHTTNAIRGVKEVVDVDILTAVMIVRNVVSPAHILIQNSCLTSNQIEQHNEERPNVVYIGGSQLMWARLQGIIECEVVRDGLWGYTEFKLHSFVSLPFGITFRPCWYGEHKSTNPGAIDFMVYEHRTKDGGIVTALYGASPLGTRIAARRWLNSSFNGTELIIIGEAMKDDPYSTRELYRHEV